jgi:hypothetical protein
MNQKLVKSKNLSLLIDVPVYTIRKLTREGKFPGYKVDGKNYLYDPDEIIELIKNIGMKNVNNQE